ncbi:hypothetical protein ACER0A_011930 [Haloimpatiens sp. FM7315]|uniref:hypothetical protein n=1 Tax=Haloimpatiens sp. FM7315 TaxID=3298609 RepID=UPI0035A35A20
MIYSSSNNLLKEKLEQLFCPECSLPCCVMCCNSANSLCDCCVYPMEDLINKLIATLPLNALLEIITISGIPKNILISEIIFAQNGLLNINNTEFIPICDISRLSWSNLNPTDEITLLQPVCTCADCDCYERPIRETVRRLRANTTLSLEIISNPSLIQENILLKKIGLGILIGTSTNGAVAYAFSICKVTSLTVV